MSSKSLHAWRNERQAALDELEAAHRSIGGTGRGRRSATQQINQAYAVLLSSQFQGFCRDLHVECAAPFLSGLPAPLQPAIRELLTDNRKLDKGNPSPGNIGADYNRFGLSFWAEVKKLDGRNEGRRARLDKMIQWRNAIAHQDFDPFVLGSTALRLHLVRSWRRACDHLAATFDETMRNYLQALNGYSPW